jgi:CysZ protein
VEQLTSGFRDVGWGFRVLRAHPVLWKWVIAPAVITLLVFAGLIAGIVALVSPIRDWIGSHLPGVLAGVASSLLTTLIVIGLSICCLSLFVSIAGIIAGPFNEALSERIEATLTGQPMTPFSAREFAHGAVLAVGHGIRRLLASLVGLILVFALGLVPVIGTIAAALFGGWLAARGAAYDCYDAVLARRFLPYRDKLDYLARHRMRTLGLGAAVAGMLLVPGLNLVAFGLGTAGATVAAHALAHDAQRARRDPRHR